MNNLSTGENRPNAAIIARATRIACRQFPLIDHEDQAVTMPFFRLVELMTLALDEGSRLADQHGKARPKNEDFVARLTALLNFVRRHPGTNSARVIASVLCSLYNGNRCKVDLTGLRRLDKANFEHVLNALRLDHSPVREVHEYFENGSALWEQMFAEYGFDQGGSSHE